jgi:superfamily II DNA or RNA helicase
VIALKWIEAVDTLVKDVLDIYGDWNPLIAPYLKVAPGKDVDSYLHQVEVLVRLILRRPIRIFIADEIGLGKTVTAILIAKYLEHLGEIQKVLILVPRILIPQWINELERFGIRPHRIERETIGKLEREGFLDGYYLTSIDLAKLERYRLSLLNVDWGLVIIDEAHRLAIEGSYEPNDRFRFLGLEFVGAKPKRHVLFLSATPHRGKPEDYIERLRLLDPHLLRGKHLDTAEFYSKTHNVIVFRRSKTDINKIYEDREVFKKCEFRAVAIRATDIEKEFQESLIRFLRVKVAQYLAATGKGVQGLGLLTTLIFKRASSSPNAAITTMTRMLAKRGAIVDVKEVDILADKISKSIFGLGYEDNELDDEKDVDDPLNEFADICAPLLTSSDYEYIDRLLSLAREIAEKGDSKLESLVELVRYYLTYTDSKIIVFTEYRDTLEYINNKFDKSFGKEVFIKLSAKEAKSEDEFKKIKQKFETSKICRVLLATDVAAEGLNLQIANILINYEIPWSIVKLEQRMGRVWRLKQSRDVEVYTFFLTAKVDNDALQIIYAKLLNVQRALGDVKPIVGESIYIADPSSRDWRGIASQPIIEVTDRKGKPIKLTEDSIIKAYLRGEQELEELISRILVATKRLQEEARIKGIYSISNKRVVEEILEFAGFKDYLKLNEALKGLTVAIAKLHSLEADEAKGILKVNLSTGLPRSCENFKDYYDILNYILKLGGEKTQVLLAVGNSNKTFYIVEVAIRDRDDRILYKEPLGVFVESGEILRGYEFLSYLANVINRIVGVATEYEETIKIEGYRAKIYNEFQPRIFTLSEGLESYVTDLTRKGWRNQENTWLRRQSIKFTIERLIGCIIELPTGADKDLGGIPQEVKDRVEEEAMRIAIAYEERQNRKTQDVHQHSSYDIYSIDSQGRERYIEVKGHIGFEISGELTQKEYDLAIKLAEKYWLYIVYNVGTENPNLICFQNPLSSMKIKVIERKRYILTP